MDPAWLHSLSEDWVSQPDDDASADKLPPRTDSRDARTAPSRVPRRTPNSKSSRSSERNSSPLVLNERCTNESSVLGRRRLSKGSKSTADDQTAPPLGSVIRNSLQHLSTSTRNLETPEWKRRLVHGKIAYGEQRDLFSSAAAGLRDIFRQPPSGEDTVDQFQNTPSSSPPLHPSPGIATDLERLSTSVYSDKSASRAAHATTTPSPSPRISQRELVYKACHASSPSRENSRLALSFSAKARRRNASATLINPVVGAASQHASRKASGQSDIRNEDFSPILIGRHSEQGGGIEFAPAEVPVEQLHHKLKRLQMDQMLMHYLPRDYSDDANDTKANIDSKDAYIRKGGVMVLHRGGRSGDDSSYSRGLSSDLGAEISEILPEESLQASTPNHFPTVRANESLPRPDFHFSPSSSLPRAPFPSPDKRQVEEDSEKQTESSPLKLFGPYDTFTNQMLLRRISQFEEASGSPSRASVDSPEQEPPRSALHLDDREAPSPLTHSVSRFGVGELDRYEFSGNISQKSNDDALPVPNSTNDPSLEPLQDLSQDREPEKFLRRRRDPNLGAGVRLAGSTRASVLITPSDSLADGALQSALTPKRDSDLEGKRPRTSSSKDPTPKRRRTLHRSDVAFGRELRLTSVDSAHREMQFIMSTKQMDAKPEDARPTHPNATGSWSIVWPHDTATPSRGVSHHQPPTGSPLRAVQSNRPNSSDDGTKRQPSIKTQDFVDQAAQIMAMIRSQMKPGLAGRAESEAESRGTRSQPSLTDSHLESTNEPLYRPPSREGRPLPKIPQRQDDPELIKRLQRYQEQSDAGDVMSSSLRSPPPISATAHGFEESRDGDGQGDRPIHVYDIVTDLPNVRITPGQPQNHIRWRQVKDLSTDFTGQSTSRTFPTTSSRGSESRRTIMPESVLHLIPDRVGSMYLDKQHNIWVKRRDLSVSPPASLVYSDDSEEDPFASIPDLSVDITKELRNLRLAASQKKVDKDLSELQISPRSPPGAQARQLPGEIVSLPPREQSSPHMASAAREQLGRLESLGSGSPATSLEVACRESGARRRNLTISFSSPIASVIHDAVAEDLDRLEDDPQEFRMGTGQCARPGLQGTTRSALRAAGRPSSALGPGFAPRPVSRIDEQDEDSTEEIQTEKDRQVSIKGQNSLVSHKTPTGRHASLSFIINHTSNNGTLSLQADESAIIGRNVGKLSLSPLSEFTLDNADQSFGFEVSYVMGRRHMATGDGSRRVMSMTIRELVDKLGEVEPYEPFWEDMTELDLHDKRLASLHMLDEFCGRVITLDASRNRLEHLDGVPSTVRQLKVSQNLLTELTSWDHLMNLQYVDVSGNEVKSLSALKNLVHLRSIRADDNQLTSLDGLDLHDGLLSLRARNNAIERIDFSTVTLQRLTELDLDGNSVSAIDNLDMLPALSRLRLRGNRVRQLSIKCSLRALRQLDVSDNELAELDLGNFPNVRSVRADRNRIHRLSGFEQARRLDSLSLREQQGGLPLDIGFLLRAYEVRKLFLSGNYLGSFEPAVDFLNLQLLDLANCGLQRLPTQMGQLMPNLRTLNVNFNAIADLSPLRYLPRLKKLLAAGNRLADVTAVTQLLMEFPHLTRLDMRYNPVTMGFYAPVHFMLPVERSGYVDGFTLPDVDVERDGLFASRLDEAARLRRRLHHVVLVASCTRLRNLDGLDVGRRDVLTRDELLETLVAEGLLPELDETLVAAHSDVSHTDRRASAEAVSTTAA